MANVIPREWKKEIFDTLELSETLYVCLLKNTFPTPYVVGTYTTYADILAGGYEVVGTGYTAKGKEITGKATAYVDTDDRNITASNIAWTGATFSNVRYAYVYNYTTGKFRAIYDLGADYPVTSGTFTLQWSASGLMKIA